MTTANERRAAAALRRQAAEQHGERGGDAAYRAYRSAVPGIGAARKVPTKTAITATSEKRGGKKVVHTSGFFTLYERAYPMWDIYGEYEEVVRRGSGRKTLAASPDVAFLINHTGMTMARTTNGTLELEERVEGGWHDAWLNPERRDVADFLIALEDRDIDQMSYAFMIPENAGLWSEDFTRFEIAEYDIDRGDVSGVNYGANPYTDIAARTAEVLNDIEHLPEGALRAAADRLQLRGQSMPATARERIEVRGPALKPGEFARRLSDRIDRTAERLIDTYGAEAHIGSLRDSKAPWYEIRNAAGTAGEAPEPGEPADADAATVYIFDEIGGSFGTNAKQFAKDLAAITASRINLRINSPGGSVFDAIAIHSTLLAHPATVTTWVDGYACSAASVIMLAADPYDPATDTGGVRVMPGAQTMIHKASAAFEGNDDDAQKLAAFLRRQSENLAGMYAAKAGGTVDEWMEMMTAETWSFAQESVDLGLADVAVKREQAPTGDRELTERMAPDRHRRALARFGYHYEGRAAAPSPMQRRGGSSAERYGSAHEKDWRDEFSDAVKVVDKAVQTERSTPEQPKGRSIALIEAQLAASE